MQQKDDRKQWKLLRTSLFVLLILYEINNLLFLTWSSSITWGFPESFLTPSMKAFMTRIKWCIILWSEERSLSWNVLAEPSWKYDTSNFPKRLYTSHYSFSKLKRSNTQLKRLYDRVVSRQIPARRHHVSPDEKMDSVARELDHMLDK